jgi:CBS domain-containing protein
MIVQDLLNGKDSQDVATTTAERSIAEAAEYLHRRRIGALVVVNGRHQIAGILSERDIVRGLAQRGPEVLKMTVGELMTSAVLTCHPHDSLETLMATMTANRVRHLPVEDDHQLAGIITIGDVVKARLQEATREMEELREYVAAPR